MGSNAGSNTDHRIPPECVKELLKELDGSPTELILLPDVVTILSDLDDQWCKQNWRRWSTPRSRKQPSDKELQHCRRSSPFSIQNVLAKIGVCRTLKRVNLSGCGLPGVELSALSNDNRYRSFQALELQENAFLLADLEACRLLARLIRLSPELQDLNLSNTGLTSSGMYELTGVLNGHPALSILRLNGNPLLKDLEGRPELSNLDVPHLSHLEICWANLGEKAAAFLAPTLRKLECFVVGIDHSDGCQVLGLENMLKEILLQERLKKLILEPSPVQSVAAELSEELQSLLIEMARTKSALETLSVERTEWKPSADPIHGLIIACKKPPRETPVSLNVRGCVGLSNLQRTQKIKKGFPLLGPMDLKEPQCGRIFICGADKISESLTQMVTGSRPNGVISRANQSSPFIDITDESLLFQNLGGIQVAAWNLTGCHRFHGLLKSMFLKKHCAACMFVFVFKVPPGKWEEVQPKLKEDLEFWFMFIASKSMHSGSSEPAVLIVLDLSGPGEGHPEQVQLDSRITKVVTALKSKHLLNFHVESFYTHHAEGVKIQECLVERLRMWVENTTVPAACAEVCKRLTEQSLTSRKENFHDMVAGFCATSGETYKPSMGTRHVEVASHLHCLGKIVYLPKDDVKVVFMDPEVVYGEVAGLLIHYFLEKQLDIDKEDDGFASETYFTSMLDKLVEERLQPAGICIDRKELVSIMKEFDLCCEMEKKQSHGRPEKGFLIPTKMEDPNDAAYRGERELRSWKGENYFGRRIRCERPIGSIFDPSFFPKLQVHLYDKFKDNLEGADWSPPNNINCSLRASLIIIELGDMTIYIESSRKQLYDGFVDVLATIQKGSTRKVVYDMMRFFDVVICTINEYCDQEDNVELVHEIIRPECVQRLTKCLFREEQVVKVQELKEKLVAQGAPRYSHTWKYMEEFQQANDDAFNLLPRADAKDVLIAKLEDLRVLRDRKLIAHECVDEVTDCIEEFENILKTCGQGYTHLITSTPSTMYDQLRELMTSLNLHSIRSLPRLLFFKETEDGLATIRANLAVPIGKVRLVQVHFLCENRQKPHEVPEQKGYEMMVDDKTAARLRPYMAYFWKYLHVGLKVAAHVAAGAGQYVPDFPASLGMTGLVIDGLQLNDELAQPGSRGLGQLPHSEDGQQPNTVDLYEGGDPFLLELKNRLANVKVVELFNLHKVVYTTQVTSSPVGAFLCPACIAKESAKGCRLATTAEAQGVLGSLACGTPKPEACITRRA